MPMYSSAYCVWPADEAVRAEFCRKLFTRQWVNGIELGYVDHLYWPAGVPEDTTAIVTAIPGTTAINAKDPDFGLASPNEEGRQRALAFTRELAAQVAALRAEGRAIRAVQVHSAPTEFASKEAFADSLREIAALDWGGAELWVEHCDAWVPGQRPQKGYLTLTDEIEVLKEVASAFPEAHLGLVINWGRSAIEGHDAATALRHVKEAAASGFLRHVGWSSASNEETVFGYPFIDCHLPPAGLSVSPNGTLMGAEEITACVQAAGQVTFGLKVGLRPDDLDGDARLAALDEIGEFIERLAAAR